MARKCHPWREEAQNALAAENRGRLIVIFDSLPGFVCFARSLPFSFRSCSICSRLRKAQGEQDLEILVLRHQLRLLQRRDEHTPRFSRCEKLILAVLAARFKVSVHGLRQRLERGLLVKLGAMLKWHRELVARKWNLRRKGKFDRPRTTAEVEVLVVRLAKENAGWGADRIQGKLLKLGVALRATSVRDILARLGIPPAPERQRKGSR